MKRIIIAGVQSGVGKTTVALGLMAALSKRGLKVNGFKVGPDYLDPSYYRQITGRPAYNLDGWMTPRAYVRRLFTEVSRDSHISVIEGVMGLYDGFGADSEEGSTAQMSKWLQAPVVLVVDAKGMSRSVCALLMGYIRFDPKVHLAGVIFNNLGSDRHLELLEETVGKNLGLPVLGGLLRDESIRLPERHLGLIPAREGAMTPKVLKNLISRMEKHLDLDALLALANKAPTLQIPALKKNSPPQRKLCKIGVSRDNAFHFYYEDNFQLLKEAGAEITFFSPLKDRSLPKDVDGLYLGGGYPECFASGLASNKSMLKAVREFAEAGKPIYAECGGLLYLSRSVRLKDGTEFPMAGLFPFRCEMFEKRKALGYREVKIRENSILGPQGTPFRGHEFHYSAIKKLPASIPLKYTVTKRKGEDERQEGFAYKNVLASYIHAHFGSHPKIARNFVRACLENR